MALCCQLRTDASRYAQAARFLQLSATIAPSGMGDGIVIVVAPAIGEYSTPESLTPTEIDWVLSASTAGSPDGTVPVK